MNDSILRCLTPVLLEGQLRDQVLDTVRDGHHRCVVFEWADGISGVLPKTYLSLPLSDFALAPDDCPYELTCETIIDLDHATFTDLPRSLLPSFMPPPAP